MASFDPLGLIGTTVSDKYEIERVVGEGGFALVYRAMHKVWQRPVAIKVFRALSALPADQRDGLVKSFIQEGALLAELSERSAAICQARDVGMLTTSDGVQIPYMVLEWLEGRTLEQVIEDEQAAGLAPRSPAEVLRILEPAALALALAHKKGIAHRDVKPANLFVLGDPRGDFTVKILDFGIAKVVQDVQREAGAFQQTQGVVSSFTPAYGAPEQFSRTHGATGPWTDVFALALIFTELLTNAPALNGGDLTQLAFCSIDPQRRPTPRTAGYEITDALEAVLRRAVAVSPDERFASMGDFWSALRAALEMDSLRVLGSLEATGNPVAPAGLAATSLAPPPAQSRVSGVVSDVLAAPGPNVATLVQAPAPKNTVALFAGAGAAVALVAALIAGGVYMFALRGRDAPAVEPGAAANVTSAAPVTQVAPPTTCPGGMVLVSGGKFFMGSDDKDDEESERPAHQVTLSPFCMDATEVTVKQYVQCSDKGECKRAPRENDWPGITARDHKIYDPLCNIRDAEAKATYPINCIDWELAEAYCKASGRRLPTEAEWEYATRGSDGRKYPWGDDLPTAAHLNACGSECLAWAKKNNEHVKAMYTADDGWATTAPVGSFPKGSSAFGLSDVVGNVWEWVSDWYAPYTPAPQTDPQGGTGTDHVLRGGAWNGGEAAWVRPTYRFKSQPLLRSHGVGFRCAANTK